MSREMHTVLRRFMRAPSARRREFSRHTLGKAQLYEQKSAAHHSVIAAESSHEMFQSIQLGPGCAFQMREMDNLIKIIIIMPPKLSKPATGCMRPREARVLQSKSK
jgi:hypothetical protein